MKQHDKLNPGLLDILGIPNLPSLSPVILKGGCTRPKGKLHKLEVAIRLKQHLGYGSNLLWSGWKQLPIPQLVQPTHCWLLQWCMSYCWQCIKCRYWKLHILIIMYLHKKYNILVHQSFNLTTHLGPPNFTVLPTCPATGHLCSQLPHGIPKK